MSKLILLNGEVLTNIDHILFCFGSLKDDWYYDDDENMRQHFCWLTKITLIDQEPRIYFHVFEEFLQAIEKGMKSDDPIIKPRVVTKDDWY